jgi:hypothetical protein
MFGVKAEHLQTGGFVLTDRKIVSRDLVHPKTVNFLSPAICSMKRPFFASHGGKPMLSVVEQNSYFTYMTAFQLQRQENI